MLQLFFIASNFFEKIIDINEKKLIFASSF